jgi:thiamine-monophosphate kinase
VNLGHYGEDRLVAELTRSLPHGLKVRVGTGDDCAVIGARGDAMWQLLKTDCVIEGVHFLHETVPAGIGWKALARTVSDIAAMGGVPRHALVTIAISPETEVERVKWIYRGLRKAARAFGVGIVGGETARSPGPLFLSVTLTGEVEPARCILRSGGKQGDLLYVTGRLGGSLRGWHLNFSPRLTEARWLTKSFRIHAMMDLSDGLGADLPRLGRASGTGYELETECLPLNRGCSTEQAIRDGEDYELLFAIAPRDCSKLEAAWRCRFPKLPLTRIGRLTGRPQRLSNRGFDHFA